MKRCYLPLAIEVALTLLLIASASGEQVLETGDLAIGRVFAASSTCGVSAVAEEYCLPQDGNVCFSCNASDPDLSHNPPAINDGDSTTWWQSAAGRQEVSLELWLETEFSFSHVILSFESLRPAAAVIEKSRNFGQSYQVLQYYSKDCQSDFGLPDNSSYGAQNLDEVICTSQFSARTPYSGGELIYRVLPPSLGIMNLSDPEVLEKTVLTNLRIRFLRFNTFPKDNLSDPDVRRNYYYAVNSIFINGWCYCDGTLESCSADPNAQPGMVNSVCPCDSGYFYSISDGCQACNCHSMGSLSVDCETGTGQCSCRPGVGGEKCGECQQEFFGLGEDGCRACNCSIEGSVSRECDRTTGQCECKPGYGGRQCSQCSAGATGPDCASCLDGYYRTSSGCEPCDCLVEGSMGQAGDCNPITGQCPCVEGVGGRRCDMCPEGTVGPSDVTFTPCIDCFCNDASSTCVSARGWYQTSIENTFESAEEVNEFTSNGVITWKNMATGSSLSATPPTGRSRKLVLSFPQEYIGDKRTAYGQNLFLQLLVNRAPDDSCKVSVVMTTRLSPRIETRLELPLQCPPQGRASPHTYEIPLVPGEAIVDFLFFRRRARQTDIRKVLANIQALELVVTFTSNTGVEFVDLYSSRLSFASNATDPSPLIPEVHYVENCSCPPNRQGQHCGQCAPGYTTDPAFAGEFALCVKCFCNFHSEMCHPMSGVCMGCRDNTTGDFCERCEEGFYRESSLTIDGCLPCDCFPRGTVGGVCRTNQTCVCRDGFTGPRCDRCEEGLTGRNCDLCQHNTTGIYPSCEPCGQCTGDWWSKINPLRTDIEVTIQILQTLNQTNGTVEPIDIPVLVELFELIAEVQRLLNASRVDELAADIESNHTHLCLLINQTRGLIVRAEVIQSSVSLLEINVTRINSSLAVLIEQLNTLSLDLDDIQRQINAIDIDDPQFYISLAQAALNRSNMANEIVQDQIESNLIPEIESILSQFYEKLNDSQFQDRYKDIRVRLENLTNSLSVYHDIIVEASQLLCAGNGTCGGCGGVECDMCGGEGCGGLVDDAQQAVNFSSQALSLIQEALSELEPQLVELLELANVSGRVLSEAEDAQEFANATKIKAEEFFRSLDSLVDRILQELNLSRIDPDMIGQLENMTLALNHSFTMEEFLNLLVQINSTIEMFFNGTGVDEAELRMRAEAALATAQTAYNLTVTIVADSEVLDETLQLRSNETDMAMGDYDQAQSLVEDVQSIIETASTTLDGTMMTIANIRSSVAALEGRLAGLEVLVEENERRLGEARNLTDKAQRQAETAEQGALEVNMTFGPISAESAAKLRQSTRDLEVANDLRNRTETLLKRTQDQLLLVEYYERLEQELLREQEEIRMDVQRVANELERLDLDIAQRIAKNTACLDVSALDKK